MMYCLNFEMLRGIREPSGIVLKFGSQSYIIIWNVGNKIVNTQVTSVNTKVSVVKTLLIKVTTLSV